MEQRQSRRHKGLSEPSLYQKKNKEIYCRDFINKGLVWFINSIPSLIDELKPGLPADRLKPLKRVQLNAARVVTGARRRDRMTPHLKDLHWLPIPYRIDYKIAVLLLIGA